MVKGQFSLWLLSQSGLYSDKTFSILYFYTEEDGIEKKSKPSSIKRLFTDIKLPKRGSSKKSKVRLCNYLVEKIMITRISLQLPEIIVGRANNQFSFDFQEVVFWVCLFFCVLEIYKSNEWIIMIFLCG